MRHQLTEFQQATTQAIRELLAERKRQAESEEVAGDREKYVIVSFAGYQIYIYKDGAEILGNGLDRRFEKEDYRSLDALQKELLFELRPLV